jgi:hypothetical protein
VVRYLAGQQYEPHVDWFGADQPHLFRGGGQRVVTVFVYLAGGSGGSFDVEGDDEWSGNATQVGPHVAGGTAFPLLHGGAGLQVRPPNGAGVVWWNVVPRPRGGGGDGGGEGDAEATPWRGSEMVGDDRVLHAGMPMPMPASTPLQLHAEGAGGAAGAVCVKYGLNAWGREGWVAD